MPGLFPMTMPPQVPGLGGYPRQIEKPKPLIDPPIGDLTKLLGKGDLQSELAKPQANVMAAMNMLKTLGGDIKSEQGKEKPLAEQPTEGKVEVKYARIEDLNDFNKELAKLKEYGILTQEAMPKIKGKGNELAKRTLSVFGGNDLTPQASRSLKEMKFILEDSPDLIKLVPKEDIDLVMEYMRQNAGTIYPKLEEITKLSTPTDEQKLENEIKRQTGVK